MDKMKKIYKISKYVYDFIPIAAMLAMLACVVIQVVARYILQALVPWTEEASRYLLIFICATGAVTVSRKGDHLGAYFFRDAMPFQLRNWFGLISAILSTAFVWLVAYGCYSMYLQQAAAALPATTIPWYQTRTNYLIFSIGCALMSIYTIRDIVWSIRHIVKHEPMDNEGRSSPDHED